MDLIGGGTPKTSREEYWNGDIPWISVKDFNNNLRYVYKTEKSITKKGLENSSAKLLHKGDMIISARGTVGEIASIPFDMSFNQSCYGLRARKNIVTNDFLYYLIKYKISDLKRQSHGSVFDTITRDTFRGIEVNIPCIENQYKIANILSKLDYKIELNNQINRNLSEQAQAVFNSWFVKYEPFDEPMKETPTGFEAPESFEYVQIDSLEHVLETGRRPKGGAVSEGIPSVGAESVKGIGTFNTSSAKYIPVDFAAKQKTGKVNGYELMIYKDGGKPGEFHPNFSMFGEGYPFDEFFINEHVFKLDFGDRGYNEFAYFWFQTDYVMHWLESNGGKAAIPGINQTVVNSIWILSPDSPKVKEYCEWIQPLFTQILKNCYSNLRLAELRDTLLPKLMSGELDVSDLNV